MSLQFSDTVLGRGIVQTIEKRLGMNPGDISGNTVLLNSFTAEINLALDAIWAIILQASGKWSLDDTNFTDYPFIYCNLVSGQRDYPFVTDGSGNIILDIFRVMCADPTGTYHEIYPVNQKAPTSHTGNLEHTDRFINGLNASGTPTRYDKTGNSIFLDVIPNYNMNSGLKVFIDREASYFAPTDSVKKPGFAGIFHEYLAIRPAYIYAGPKGLANTKDLQMQMTNMERAVEMYYCQRAKDTPQRMLANVENNK